MKKVLVFVFGVVFTGAIALYLGVFFGERWINKNLAQIINANPERAYDITFEKVDYDLLKRSILVNGVKIRPLGTPKGMYVEGEVSQASLSSVNARKLFFRKILDIQELRFLKPDFQVHIPENQQKQERAGEALQSLFGDILSRGGIRNFLLGKANSTIFLGEKKIGYIANLSIEANDLSTDSLLWNHPIPFEYGRIRLTVDSLGYDLANGQHLKVGRVNFDTQSQQFKLQQVSFLFPEGLEAASRKLDYQTDLFDIKVDTLLFSGIEANSNFYSDMDLRAKKLELNGLQLTDFRNKSKPRPKNKVKPMFQGLVEKISFPLKLDTLQITNSNITYGENVPANGDRWKLHFNDLNGTVTNLTSISEYKTVYSHFDAKMTGKIEGKGKFTVTMQVPYDRDEFDLELNFRNFNMRELNSILKPIMNGDIVSGKLDRMNLRMHATTRQTKVSFIFDYTDLKIELFKKGTQKKNKLLSSIANLALNHSNMPGEKRYLSPSFSVSTNLYRGPFFLIWQSTKEGMLKVVPGGAVKEILKTSDR